MDTAGGAVKKLSRRVNGKGISLNLISPVVPADPVRITVSNPDGTSYFLDVAYLVQ